MFTHNGDLLRLLNIELKTRHGPKVTQLEGFADRSVQDHLPRTPSRRFATSHEPLQISLFLLIELAFHGDCDRIGFSDFRGRGVKAYVELRI